MNPDVTAPGAVEDLVVAAVTDAMATLEWSAPGNDGDVGTAAAYDIRWSPVPITPETWAEAAQVETPPKPQPAGSPEMLSIPGLTADTVHHFALMSRDDAGNWSSLSNVASDTTTGVPVVVVIEPATATVLLKNTFQFTATVTGADDTEVIWWVEGGVSHGILNASGLYFPPSAVPSPATVMVRATSQADPTVTGTATIMVVAPDPPPPGFARVPAGSFEMGDGVAHCGATRDLVRLTEDFDLGRTEVTNRQYMDLAQWAYDQGHVTVIQSSLYDIVVRPRKLLDLEGPNSEIAFDAGTFRLRDGGHGINPDHPVKEVTWYGAAAYCDWLSLNHGLSPAYDHTTWACNDGDPYRAEGYRLPTDAEWEFAAQYDDERKFPWGGSPFTPPFAGNFSGIHTTNVGWTAPVGSYPAEKTFDGLGIHDMGGNVWEWCNDWHACEGPSRVDPPGPTSGSTRVRRGGGWSDPIGTGRCANRFSGAPSNSHNNIGFRVARTVAP